MAGRVVLVGAGPGDPDLLTVRAVRELERAEVVLYDALIDPTLLLYTSPACERIDVGKRGDGSRGIAQSEIADLLIARARAGQRVVRLKGGDPFVFGRGGEEAEALRAAGIAFEIVPGVSSALAVPAYAGIPVTDRETGSSVAVVTGHRASGEGPEAIDWPALATAVDTIVVLMGTRWLPVIAERLRDAGRAGETPVAVIERGTTPEQRVVRGTLDDIAQRVEQAGLRAPTVIVVGEVVRRADALAWYEARPLFGRRVLVGRTAGQAADWLLELRRRGARGVPVPLLEIAPVAPAELEGIAADWRGAERLVFTSANAVRALVEASSAEQRAAAPVAACVGAATAAAARAAGFRVDRVPDVGSDGAALARALLDSGAAAGQKLLFPRAERARPELAAVLRGAGLDVAEVVVYRTRAPAELRPRLAEAVAAGLDAVALGSPSSVEHLFEALDPGVARDLLAAVCFVAIGPTTARALAERQPKLLCTAETPDARGVCEALERWFSSDKGGE